MRNEAEQQPAQAIDPHAAAVAASLPRDGVEFEVASIWCEILKQTSLRNDDNFFDVGGDSFKAVRLVAAIRARYGISIPLSALLSHRDITSHAKLIRAGSPSPAARDATITLQAGAGDKVLHVLPPVSGTLTRYAPLVAALGQDVTVLGLETPGLHEGEVACTSMEELAGYIWDKLRRDERAAPLNILGYSFGGFVAYEVARLAQAEGVPLGLVGALDAYPHLGTAIGVEQAVEVLARTGLRVSVDVQSLMKLDELRRAETLTKLGVGAGTLPADYDARRLELMLRMYQRNDDLLRTYVPGLSDIDVTLFKAQDTPEAARFAHDLTWSSWAPRVNVLSVAGDHFHMLETAHVTALASHIRSRLVGNTSS